MMIMMMMTMNSHDNNVSFIFPSRSSTRITDSITFKSYWAIKIIWRFRYTSYNHARLFHINVQEYCHFPFYHTIKCSKCFGKNIYLRFNGEIKDNMVSATQPKEFIMQHYRDLKVYKDQINANVQCNTLLNSPLQKQIARFHYLCF